MDSLNLVPADLGLLVTSVTACAPSGHMSLSSWCSLIGRVGFNWRKERNENYHCTVNLTDNSCNMH